MKMILKVVKILRRSNENERTTPDLLLFPRPLTNFIGLNLWIEAKVRVRIRVRN